MPPTGCVPFGQAEALIETRETSSDKTDTTIIFFMTAPYCNLVFNALAQLKTIASFGANKYYTNLHHSIFQIKKPHPKQLRLSIAAIFKHQRKVNNQCVAAVI